MRERMRKLTFTAMSNDLLPDDPNFAAYSALSDGNGDLKTA